MTTKPDSVVLEMICGMLRPFAKEVTAEHLQNFIDVENNRPPAPPELVTRKEACALLRMSIATIDRLVQRGELTLFKSGRGRGNKSFITRDSVDDYIRRMGTYAEGVSETLQSSHS